MNTAQYLGSYQYTKDLLALHNARPPELVTSYPELGKIVSPIKERLPCWQRALTNHPDREFVRYIVEGIETGFRVGFDHSRALTSVKSNMGSAKINPEIVDSYISGEIAAGRMFGPFAQQEIPGLHINRMGLIPKGHTPGKWRLITDLSYPEGASVNDGIQPQWCSLHYTTVESVATAAQQLGKGALLAKLDIKSAYRIVPVHPHDRQLMGVEWKDAHYVDGALPFGLRSAPKIFTAIADALQWIMRQNGVSMVEHYLDDFITMGPPGLTVCRQNLERILSTCEELGVPLAEDKLEGPTCCLTFLGIEVDTQTGMLRLPAEKLSRMKDMLSQWSMKKSCQRRQLESLIGTLQHACRVIKPGRTFLRRMIDLLRTPSATKPHHHIRLNCEFRADLQWWRVFAVHWNGVAMFPLAAAPVLEMTSDASGGWGCGAWSGSRWFQFQWCTQMQGHHIAFKELFAGLLACIAWGRGWHGKRIRWLCDNQAAVYAVNNRACRDPNLMHLIRCLFFLEAWYEFEITATHLPGKKNTLADDLSRNRVSHFLSQAHNPESSPTLLRPEWPGVLQERPGWTSPRWTEQFASIVTGD